MRKSVDIIHAQVYTLTIKRGARKEKEMENIIFIDTIGVERTYVIEKDGQLYERFLEKMGNNWVQLGPDERISKDYYETFYA